MPLPGVADANLRIESPTARGATSTRAALGRELDRVRQQIPDDLLQARGVAGDRRHVGIGRRRRARSPWPRAAGRIASSAAATIAARSTGAMSRRILPEMMRDTSRRSSISFTCRRVLRSIASSACAVRAVVEPPDAQQRDPGEDRAERRAQLVRERGQELVLGAVRGLGAPRAPPARASSASRSASSAWRARSSARTVAISTGGLDGSVRQRVGAALERAHRVLFAHVRGRHLQHERPTPSPDRP